MTRLGARLLACFLEPGAPVDPGDPRTAAGGERKTPGDDGHTGDGGPHAGASAGCSPRFPPPSAVVLGSRRSSVVPVAAAVAGELRVRARAAAATVAVWSPGRTAATAAGAATPGARRLEQRLSLHGERRATACGRLAWLVLQPDAEQAARTLAVVGGRLDAPVVLALCGPRPQALEPLLASLQLGVAVVARDADPDLRTLALAALPTPARAIHAPLPPGPPRWTALAGLARLRSLPPLPLSPAAA